MTTGTIILGILFLVSLIVILSLMARDKPEKGKEFKPEQSDGLLVAMHTFFKAAGENKKAGEIAAELKRRGYRDDSSPGSDIGVWNKDD